MTAAFALPVDARAFDATIPEETTNNAAANATGKPCPIFFIGFPKSIEFQAQINCLEGRNYNSVKAFKEPTLPLINSLDPAAKASTQ